MVYRGKCPVDLKALYWKLSLSIEGFLITEATLKKGGNGKRDKIKIPFVAIPYDVLFHKSFLSLSNSAKVIYLAMAAKVRCALGSERYSFEIVISYSELTKWNFSTATICKAIRELETSGHLEVKEAGGLKGCKGTTSKYMLSERYKKL